MRLGAFSRGRTEFTMERYTRYLSILLYFVILFNAAAQTKGSEKNVLIEFRDASGPSLRFKVFFESGERYTISSAYDWLDTIKIYLANGQTTQDSTAFKLYKVMEAQVYNDLGVYDKS